MERRQVLGSIAGMGAMGITGPLSAARRRSDLDATSQPSATVRWAQTYEREASWTFEAGVPTDDGGAVVCGWESRTAPFTGEAVLAKIADDGSIEWETTISGDANTYALWDVTRYQNGYAAVGGEDVQDRDQTRERAGSASSQLIVVFDDSGTEQWRQQLSGDRWVHSAIGIENRVVIGRDNEFREFLGPNEQGRAVRIDDDLRDQNNDFVIVQPEAVTVHDGRMYAACTRNEGYQDDDGRIHVPHREPMLFETTTSPIQIINTYRYEFDQYHWTSDLVVRDDGIYLAGVRSRRQQFIRDPDLEGWLMRIDDEGSQQWYETVSDESGVRFTGLASHPSWDALLATGQTLNRGRAYLASTSGGSIDQLYEQDTDGLLADVTGTSIGAALLNGSNDDQNNDPFAASIAVDPSEDDVTLSIDPVAPAVGESIRASVAVDGQWTPASIEWSGDVDGSGESIETSFDEAGSYIIAVAVSNEVGGQVRLEESVSVGEADGDGSGSDDDGLPGFGVPAALAGVAGGLGLAYGRKRLQDQSTAEE